jgi:hypothetical protein
MIRGKALRQILDKFINKSEVSQNARVQVCLPNGELYDINGLQLMVLDTRHSLPKLYEGKNILQLVACGLKLDACCLSLDACYNLFKRL